MSVDQTCNSVDVSWHLQSSQPDLEKKTPSCRIPTESWQIPARKHALSCKSASSRARLLASAIVSLERLAKYSEALELPQFREKRSRRDTAILRALSALELHLTT